MIFTIEDVKNIKIELDEMRQQLAEEGDTWTSYQVESFKAVMAHLTQISICTCKILHEQCGYTYREINQAIGVK